MPAGRPARPSSCQLLRARHLPQGGIPVPAGEAGGAGIADPREQRHQPELPPRQPEEALPQQIITGRVLGEPLARSGSAHQKANTPLVIPPAWPHSRACTLATLSSRVWSLSVRVLILTVV